MLQGSTLPAKNASVNPDDELGRYLVYPKYRTLNLRPLMVYPKVLFPTSFIITVRDGGSSNPPSTGVARIDSVHLHKFFLALLQTMEHSDRQGTAEDEPGLCFWVACSHFFSPKRHASSFLETLL